MKAETKILPHPKRSIRGKGGAKFIYDDNTFNPAIEILRKVYRMPCSGQRFKIGSGSYEVVKSVGMKFTAVLKEGESIQNKPKFTLRDTKFIVIKNLNKRITCGVR